MDGRSFINHLMEVLFRRFDIRKLKAAELPHRYLEFERKNVVNSVVNEKLQLQEDALDIEVFKIMRSAVSEEYFSFEKSHYTNYEDEFRESILLVCVEKKTGYFSTNSSKLFLEFILDIGVSDEDRRNRTFWYQQYLSAREHYKRFYSKK